jgi:hypothetical protein
LACAVSIILALIVLTNLYPTRATHAQLHVMPGLADDSIVIQAFTPAVHTAFLLLDTDAFRRVAPYVVIVTNRSNSEVIAATFVTTVTDRDGRVLRFVNRNDSMDVNDTDSVIPAYGQRAFPVQGELPASTFRDERHGFYRLPSEDTLEALSMALTIEFLPDMLLFRDGRMVGPDTFESVQHIANRNATARSIGTKLSVATDPSDRQRIIDDVTIQDGISGSIHERLFIRSYARMLMNLEDDGRSELSMRMANLPDLPPIRSDQGKQSSVVRE